MIPKIIHYCWLSEDPYPKKIKKYMNSWKKYLPDYEFMLWDTKRFDINSLIWVNQAFENKKYAFAADYIRLYALYNFGGIYLDTDVEVLKSFNHLLDLPYFMGQEPRKDDLPIRVEPAIIGANKGCSWIRDCMDYYINRHFVNDNIYDMRVLPDVIGEVLENNNYKILYINGIDTFSFEKKTVCILPVDWFSPKGLINLFVDITENTYCIHQFASAWRVDVNIPFVKKLNKRIKLLLGKKITYKIINIKKIIFH